MTGIKMSVRERKREMKVPIKKYLFGLMGFTKYYFLKGTSRMLDASEAALKKECVPKYVKQNKYFF